VVTPPPPPTTTTFTVTETSGVISFGGTATGVIIVTLSGTDVTFSRDGVSGAEQTPITTLVGKQLSVDSAAASGSASFEVNSTLGNDVIRLRVADSTAVLTLTGNLGTGADTIALVLPNDTNNTQALQLISSVTLDGADDILVAAFSAGDDVFRFSAGSIINGYETLQVRGGSLLGISQATFDSQPAVVFVGVNDGGSGL